MLDADTIDEVLDDVVRAAKASQYADVCANSCNTERDHEAAYRAEDKLSETLDAARARLGGQA